MVRGLIESQWHEAADAKQLAANLAESVERNLVETIESQGRASLVVSGGSTPLPFFEQLSRASLDWSLVDVTLADERWVPEDHEDSNALFVRTHFLKGNASKASFYSLYRDTDAQTAIADVERALQGMIQPFSVVVLGMGGDGHTASLFPETPGLEDALDMDTHAMLAVLEPATVPQQRISLTRAALMRSRYRYLHITGEQKRDVLGEALKFDDENPLPIASFFEKHLPPISAMS